MKGMNALIIIAITLALLGCINTNVNNNVNEAEETEATGITEATSTTVEEITTTTLTETSRIHSSTTIPETSIASTTTASTTTLLGGFCTEDNDCPKAFNSTTYCWKKNENPYGDEGRIYMDEVSYVCSGKGTPNARCAEVRERMAVDTCVASKCFNGVCYPTHCFDRRLHDDEQSIDCGGECPDCSLKLNITCFNDCDCLSRGSQLYGNYYSNCIAGDITASEFLAQGRCLEYTIFQDLLTHKCVKPGTIKSKCVSNVTQQMMTATCRNRNCTLDCEFKTKAYPNLAVINDLQVEITSMA